MAVALTEDFEEFEWQDGDAAPLPDIAELDGAAYFSQPTAVRRQGARFVLERRRETVDAVGERATTEDRIALDSLSTAATSAGGRQRGSASTRDRAGFAPTDGAHRQRGGDARWLTLRVCALYPDLMNIYADRGNLLMLERRCDGAGSASS